MQSEPLANLSIRMAAYWTTIIRLAIVLHAPPRTAFGWRDFGTLPSYRVARYWYLASRRSLAIPQRFALCSRTIVQESPFKTELSWPSARRPYTRSRDSVRLIKDKTLWIAR